MTTLKLGNRGDDVKALQRILNLHADGIFGTLTDEAVREFQKSHNLISDGVVGSKTRAELEKVANSCKREINEIIIHCSATPEGKDYSVEQIRQWHTLPKPKGNGWSDIGYHYVIYRDGSINIGRSESVAGAHCTGHNTHSIGVCYVGGYASDGRTPKDTRTKEQRASLIFLLQNLKSKYPNAVIRGHRDFAIKACPSLRCSSSLNILLSQYPF